MMHHNAVPSIIYFAPIKLLQVLTVAGVARSSGVIDMQDQNSKDESTLAIAEHVQRKSSSELH